MSIEVEADIDQDSTIYEALYDQYFEGWSQKLQPHRKAIKILSDMIQTASIFTTSNPLKILTHLLNTGRGGMASCLPHLYSF